MQLPTMTQASQRLASVRQTSQQSMSVPVLSAEQLNHPFEMPPTLVFSNRHSRSKDKHNATIEFIQIEFQIDNSTIDTTKNPVFKPSDTADPPITESPLMIQEVGCATVYVEAMGSLPKVAGAIAVTTAFIVVS